MKKLLTILTAILLLFVGMSFAQYRYGQIEGSVVDSEGTPLPGVAVTLESEMVPSKTTVTTEAGAFVFRSLDPGTYRLSFELPGFAKEARMNIRVLVGKTLDFHIVMAQATLEEEVTVTAESPIVDTKKTGTSVNVTQEVLANIPSARDPWVILEQTAGIIVDRVNVGGAQSGQQSNFVARGDSGGNVMWNLDGLTITDQAALGATPTYWDFDAFEEIQITTGGADPSIQTGGIGLNFVTKRGGNKFKGQAYFYRTDNLPWIGFQTSNALDSEIGDYWRAKGLTDDEVLETYPGDRINRIKDYGFEAGGPVIKDRLWVWGAWGVQDIKMFTAAGVPDDTLLDNINLKFNAQVSQNARAEILYFRGDKLKWGRSAGPARPSETTWDQKGPSNTYKGEIEYVFSDSFFATLRGGFVDMWFQLWPKGGGPEVANPPITELDYNTGIWHENFLYYRSMRPGWHFNGSANLFLEDILGGDHEWKFGAEYRTQSVRTQYGWPGNIVKTYYGYGAGAESVGAWLVRPEDFKEDYTRISAWIGDTFTVGRLTLIFGARYDHRQNGHTDIGSNDDKDSHEYGTWNETPKDYVQISDLLPPVRQEGIEDVITWNNFSPRAGFTLDITGDGKTLLRGNWAIYYDQLSSADAYRSNASAYGETDFAWNDANGDKEVQADELGDLWWVSPTVDPDNPSVYPSVIDGGLTAPKTMEIIAGLEREVFADFSVSANFVYRKMTNFTWLPIRGVGGQGVLPSSAYVENPTPITNAGREDLYDGKQYSAVYYELPFFRPAGNILINRPDHNQRYWGIEVQATKRLSNRWMMNLAFNWNDHIVNCESSAAYQDPTNVDMVNGYQFGYQTSGSGKTAIWMNSRWQFKVNGLYQLPLGFNLSAFLTARQGFPQPISIRSPVRSGGIGRENYVMVSPMGDVRLDTFWMVDFRIEKVLPIGDYGSLGIILDVFNLFNNSTTLGHEVRLNLSSAWRPNEIINPRVARLGVRFRF